MKFYPTSLRDAYVVQPEPFEDKRGIFARIFCMKELEAISHTKNVMQINHSRTVKRGTIRGIHYQRPPKAEIKIVKCIHGAVFDVIVDLRKESPTFCQWHGELLSAENMKIMYVPEGFAHGFQTMEEKTELLYLHTEFYSPEHEGGVRYNDPMLSISWPLEVTEVSKKDQEYPLLSKDFQGMMSQ
jgi:dTDP-4-dehydrorhamnose 3,5-epimerase